MNRNTKKLQKQISKKLAESDSWVVLRMDKNDNFHVHCPDFSHLHLIPFFLHSNDEIKKQVFETLDALDKTIRK
jgi:hypothetical protein